MLLTLDSFSEDVEAEMDVLATSTASFEYLLKSKAEMTSAADRRSALRRCHALLAELDDIADTYPDLKVKSEDVRSKLGKLTKLLNLYPLRDEELASLSQFQGMFSREWSPSSLSLLYFQVIGYRSHFFSSEFAALAAGVSDELVASYPNAMKLMAKEPGGRVYARLSTFSEISSDLKSRLDSVFEAILASQESPKDKKMAWQGFVSWKLLCVKMIIDSFGKKFPRNSPELLKIETSLKIAEQAFSQTLDL